MTKAEQKSPTEVAQGAPANEPRISFERLRERTDELELIISGLTVFALFALPELLLSVWLRVQAHVEGELSGGLSNAFVFASGLSYTLAITFVVHLAIRAYWVGLIGLKSVYPKGVRWDATPTMGPVGREYFRRRLPDIDAAIHRADRAASIIFALAGLVAILVAWIGVIIALVIALMSLAREALGMSHEAGDAILFGAIGLLMALTVFNWLVDTRLFKDEALLARYPRLRRWVEGSVRLTNAVIPQRLILPVQLTLQSNLPPRRFFVGFAIAISVVPLIGVASMQTRMLFAPVNSYEFFDDVAAESSMRSAYYESLRNDDDRGLYLPSIPSDRVADSFLRIFLPHLPSRDNDVLRAACSTAAPADPNSTAVAPDGTDRVARIASPVAGCLAKPWRVLMDGRDVPLADFVIAERRDLGARGLQGYVPLAGFTPGRHDLVITWNPGRTDDDPERHRDYHIPFWFAPAYEFGAEESSSTP